jgi:hypothetical protein
MAAQTTNRPTPTKGQAQPASTPAAPVAAPKRRGRRPGQVVVPRDLSGISLELLSGASVISAPEQVRQLAPVRVRSDIQLVVDSKVAESYKLWNGLGKPASWNTCRGAIIAFPCPPDQADNVKYMVRRAADFLGIAVKFGKPARSKDGHEVVSFCAKDRRPRGSAEDTDDDE